MATKGALLAVTNRISIPSLFQEFAVKDSKSEKSIKIFRGLCLLAVSKIGAVIFLRVLALLGDLILLKYLF